MHLAVALDGAGWHPAAWREPRARPDELFTGRYWTDVIAEAERGLLDFVTIEDGFCRPVLRGPTEVTGRLDAVLIAARVAPLTRHIGLIPTVITTHTEPFHLSKAIATLDYASKGRAGVRVRVSASARRGRAHRPPGTPARRPMICWREAADYVEVIRRLWDSWDDDAVIRDAATGRFIDRDRLHYIDFSGAQFSVKGPSITPRPPQGQPVVSALGHGSTVYPLIAKSADVGFVTPGRRRRGRGDRGRDPRRAGGRPGAGGRRPGRLPGRDGRGGRPAARRGWMSWRATPYTSDATVFTGTPAQLAHLLLDWQRAGLAGFRLRPGAIPDDLEAITRAASARASAARRVPDRL